MSILVKKNNDNIIKKVRVKMTCSCHCYAVCTCSCTSTDGFVAPHGSTDADTCAKAYYRMFDKIDGSLINK